MRTTSSSPCWFCGSAGVVVCADAAAQRMAAPRKKASASLMNLKSPFKSIRLVEYFGQGRPKASKGVRDFDARIIEHGCRKSESGKRPKKEDLKKSERRCLRRRAAASAENPARTHVAASMPSRPSRLARPVRD